MTTNLTVTGSTVTVTDDGSTVVVTASSTGPQGATGEGVPAGGTARQALLKIDGTDYNTEFDTVETADVNGLDSALAGKSPSSCLWLSGTASNSISCPDAAGLDVVGDIDLRVKVAMDDWTPAADMVLIAKYGSAPNRSYWFNLDAAGTLRLYWTADGTTAANLVSSVATGLSNGTAKWVRVTLDVDNGAAGRTARFYLSDDDGTTWTQLGTDQTSAGVTSIYAGTATLVIGALTVGSLPAAGKFYRGQVLNGIGGTLVADWQADIPAARYRDAYANVWTVNGTANAWMEA